MKLKNCSKKRKFETKAKCVLGNLDSVRKKVEPYVYLTSAVLSIT